MKKSVLLFLTCLAIVTGANAAYWKDARDSGFSIIRKGTVLNVLYKSDTSSDVKVSIYDSENNLVFKEVLKNSNGFSRPYNMARYSEGRFVVEIEDRSGINRKTVDIEKKKNSRAFHIERVHGVDDKILLTVAKSSKGFNLRIEDRNGRKLFSENKILDGDFACVYNLSEVSGEISVVVTDFHGNESKFEFR